MNLSEGSEQSIEANVNYPDEVQSATPTGTFFMNQVGNGEAIHDQAAAAGAGPSSRKKRRGPPLSEEERIERKRNVQKQSRDKKKAKDEKTKEDLTNTEEKVEDLERENRSLNERIKSSEQQLKDAYIRIGEFSSLIERLNETDNSKQQAYVGKLEEELQGLKIECHKLECENASLKAERDVMTIDLQASAANTEEILLEELLAKAEQWAEDFYTNEPNQTQELPMEQEQSGLEGNGRLGFVGDGRPITTTEEIQQLKSMLMKITTQMDATLMEIKQISQMISTLETRNPPSQAYRVAKGGIKLGASSAML